MADPKEDTGRGEETKESLVGSGGPFERGAQIMNYDLSNSNDPPVDPPPGSDD